MDDDLKLVERLKNGAIEAGYHGYDGTVLQEASKAITRLHAEIEALKSDVSDLVRAGSDEATENERLVKERDEANVRVRAITEVLNFSAEQTQTAEAQRDAALEALRPFAVWAQKMPDGVAPKFGYEIASILAQAAVNGDLTGEHFRAARRTLEGGEG